MIRILTLTLAIASAFILYNNWVHPKWGLVSYSGGNAYILDYDLSYTDCLWYSRLDMKYACEVQS